MSRLTAVVLLLGSLAPSTIGAASRHYGGAGALTPADVCADPDDCRLWEAGRIGGVGVGFAGGVPSGRRREAQLAETNIAVNHALSWRTSWPERDRWNFEPADAIMAFHRENGLRSMAFHFVWEQEFLDDLPDWVLEVDDPDELRALLVERAAVIFERYPDLDRINVINEPLPTLGGSAIHENYFFRVLGPDYIAELFGIVDAYAPDDVKLVLNENFVEYLPEKADGLVALVAELVQRGMPIDSVGFQTHLMLTELLGRQPDWDLYQDTMRQISDLGLDVWISELDNPVEPARPNRFEYQADNYARAVEACLSVPRCSDILIWGVQDGPAYWFPLPYDDPAPLLFDQDFERKPAYFAVRDALLAGRRYACAPSPDATCLEAAQAKLVVHEKKAGKERLKLKWKRITTPTTQGEFGDPVAGDTSVAACVYDDARTLLGEYVVARADQSCGGGKACWKAKGARGYVYADKDRSAAGISKLLYLGGDASKGKAVAQGRNNAVKGHSSLPTGLAAALAGNTAPTIQLTTRDGWCVGATVSVTKDDGVRYEAKRAVSGSNLRPVAQQVERAATHAHRRGLISPQSGPLIEAHLGPTRTDRVQKAGFVHSPDR